MKYISAKQLSEELNLDEDVLYTELVEVKEEEAQKNPDAYFILNEDIKGLFVVEKEDIDIISNGVEINASFATISESLQIDSLHLYRLLEQLHKLEAISQETFEHYVNIKERPLFRAFFEPEKILVGNEVSLVIELFTEKEIDQPKYILDFPSDIELVYESTLPENLMAAPRIDRFHFLGLRHGPIDVNVVFEGFIEGVKVREVLSIPSLRIISLPPKLSVERISMTSTVSAMYNDDLEFKFRISNAGQGEAQNVKIAGFENHEGIRLIRGENVGILSAGGRIEHPITIRPLMSGNIILDDLVVAYEDGDSNSFQEPISSITLRVSIFKPEIKIDIDTTPVVSSREIFPLNLSVSNIGEGNAQNIRFNISVVPTEARLQGPTQYRRRILNPNMTDLIAFQLRAPEDGVITFSTTDIGFDDEEGNMLTTEFPPLQITVRKMETRTRELEWPFYPGAEIKKYKILKEIGEGGFSKVYLVEDTVMSRQKKALKALKPAFINDLSVVGDFIDEANKSINLRSANILTVYDADKVEYQGQSYPYIVMEHISGGTLREKMTPGRAMDFMESCYIIQDLCFALIAAHQQRIIHCDIKPSNTFYDEKNAFWKLGDFGMAKMMRGREAFSTGGTIAYMAPETREADAVITEKSDIYSLGVLFKEMLTGSPRGDLQSVDKSVVMDPSRINQVLDLVEKMTSRSPQQRPDLNELIRITRLSTMRGR